MSNIATVPSHVAGDPFSAGMWANLQDNINDGIVNQVCAARVYSTNNQATVGAAAPLTFNSERYDGDNIHSTSTNPSQLVCQTAGIYHIGGCVEWPVDSGAGRLNLQLRVNGSIVIAASLAYGSAATTAHQVVSCDWFLNQGDYVEFLAGSQSDLTIQSTADMSPEFWMHRV